MTQIRSYLEALMLMDDRPLPFPEGTVVFAAGAPGREMYIVRTGTVILKAGKRKLEEVGPGGVIGEMALIDPAPRSATAIAGPDCSVTIVTEHTFQDLVKKIPGLAIEVMRIITRRLRKANESQQPAPRKPAPRKPVPRKPAPRRKTTRPRTRAKKKTARRK